MFFAPLRFVGEVLAHSLVLEEETLVSEPALDELSIEVNIGDLPLEEVLVAIRLVL